MNKKVLYKSDEDKAIFGVCGGIAEYFDIDSLIVRLLFVLLAMAYFSGFAVYLLLALILPKRNAYTQYAYSGAPGERYYGAEQPGEDDAREAAMRFSSQMEQPSCTDSSSNGVWPQAAASSEPAESTVSEAADSAMKTFEAEGAEASETIRTAEADKAPISDEAEETAVFEEDLDPLFSFNAPETAAEPVKPASAMAEAAGAQQQAPSYTAPAQPASSAQTRPSAKPGQPGRPFGAGQQGQSGAWEKQRHDKFKAISSIDQNRPGMAPRQGKPANHRTLGILLVVIGLIVVLKVLIPSLDMTLVGGFGMVAVGLYLIFRKN